MIPRFLFFILGAQTRALEIGHIAIEVGERELRRITDYNPL